jgi:VWFA-related protein
MSFAVFFAFSASIGGSSIQAPRTPSKPPQTKSASEGFQHEVTVSLKLVQVHVLGPDGKPVRDLEKSDFVVFDNSRPQIITVFEKHFVTPTEARLGETRPAQARDAASLLNRKFVFLLDFESNSIWGISQSVKTARAFLDTKTLPGDEVALFSFGSIRGLILHEYFTSDADRIRAALGRVMEVPGVPAGSSPGAAITGHSLMGMEALDARDTVGAALQQRTSAQRLSKSLTDLSQVLRHIPGQKNVILFSRGFGRSVRDPGSLAEKDFQAMGRALASAGAPVFTVESSVGFDEKLAKSVLPEYSLARLSEMTGVRYFADVSYINEIAEGIQSVTGNYYILGFSIASTWDGKFHDIKVEVKRPGSRVFAPRGYFNPQPFATLTPIEKHLHLMELALGEKTSPDLRLDLPLLALPFSDKKDTPNTILLSRIPVRRIAAEIGTKTEFLALVFDAARSLVVSRRMEMDWTDFRGESLTQYSAEALPPGSYECRVIVRSMETGRAAVGACPVVIPEPAGSALKLFPPLLFSAGLKTPYLNVAGPASGGAAAVGIECIFPFSPKGLAPAIAEVKPEGTSAGAALRVAWRGPGEAAIDFSAWLVPEGRDEKIMIVPDVQDVIKGEDADALFLSFDWPALRPGPYAFFIQAKESGSGARAETWTRIVIRSN